jgi:hypothetical protein
LPSFSNISMYIHICQFLIGSSYMEMHPIKYAV